MFWVGFGLGMTYRVPTGIPRTLNYARIKNEADILKLLKDALETLAVDP